MFLFDMVQLVTQNTNKKNDMYIFLIIATSTIVELQAFINIAPFKILAT